MTALTTLQKRQRLGRRRATDVPADRRQFRVIVLPAPGDGGGLEQDVRRRARPLELHDDLAMATWEDAEWR